MSSQASTKIPVRVVVLTMIQPNKLKLVLHKKLIVVQHNKLTKAL
jgi:hypothetical protein